MRYFWSCLLPSTRVRRVCKLCHRLCNCSDFASSVLLTWSLSCNQMSKTTDLAVTRLIRLEKHTVYIPYGEGHTQTHSLNMMCVDPLTHSHLHVHIYTHIYMQMQIRTQAEPQDTHTDRHTHLTWCMHNKHTYTHIYMYKHGHSSTPANNIRPQKSKLLVPITQGSRNNNNKKTQRPSSKDHNTHTQQ